jgi:hypothetical protein
MNASTSSRPRATLRRSGYPDPGIRVSDAERADIADRLARHYGDGRLDIAEFDERVTRAMSAKTVGDFQGLFNDLPDLPGTQAGTLAGTAKTGTGKLPGTSPAAARRQRRRGRRRGLARMVLMAVLVIVAATIALHAVTSWIAPVVWLAILAAVVLIVSRVRRH